MNKEIVNSIIALAENPSFLDLIEQLEIRRDVIKEELTKEEDIDKAKELRSEYKYLTNFILLVPRYERIARTINKPESRN